jgi:repressor LexA
MVYNIRWSAFAFQEDGFMIDEKVMYSLSRRQRTVLKFIARYQSKKGYSPSIRDICKGVGLSSSSSVHLHLKTLEEKGYIRRDPTKPRTIEIRIKPEGDQYSLYDRNEESYAAPVTVEIQVKKTDKTVDSVQREKPVNNPQLKEYPLVRGYSHEIPLLDPVNIEQYIMLPDIVVGNKDAFLLRMTNNSMTGAGIFEGDICIIYPAEDFEDGEIAALYAGGNVTVKRVFRHMNAYRLEPENRKMNPVFVKEIKMIGKVRGLIRTACNNLQSK